MVILAIFVALRAQWETDSRSAGSQSTFLRVSAVSHLAASRYPYYVLYDEIHL
mgnify:CR=1 FL=1